MSTDQGEHVDALVIFGATGDLAKLETFPALVGLVERGVLDVPVVGVAKSGWGLDQFRDYARASLTLNKMDPDSPAAAKMLGLLNYVDGDLGDPATIDAAMRGISAVVLVSPAIPAQELNVVASAAGAGAGHVVKITSKASADSPCPPAYRSGQPNRPGPSAEPGRSFSEQGEPGRRGRRPSAAWVPGPSPGWPAAAGPAARSGR